MSYRLGLGILGIALLWGGTALADEYDPLGKRDPFEPNATQAADPCTPETPALCAEVSDMRLIGVLTGIADGRALLALPDGREVMVERGDAVGRHHGRVTALRNSSIVVVERSSTGVIHETVLQVAEAGAK